MTRARFRFLPAVTCVLLSWGGGRAHAQSCHSVPAAVDQRSDRPHTNAAAVAPTVAIVTEAASVAGGSFLGTTLRAHVQAGRFALGASIPYFAVARDTRYHGVGDITLTASAVLWASPHWRLGAAMVFGAPTGDAARSLGMGHWMAMPNVGVAWTRTRWALAGVAGIGKALGQAQAHAHHHGSDWAFPLVNPMNAFEGTALLRARYRAAAVLGLEVGAAVATPLDGMGRTRVVANGGMLVPLGAWRIAPAVHLALAGAPYIARGVIELQVDF